jgi:hypothetical protein
LPKSNFKKLNILFKRAEHYLWRAVGYSWNLKSFVKTSEEIPGTYIYWIFDQIGLFKKTFFGHQNLNLDPDPYSVNQAPQQSQKVLDKEKYVYGKYFLQIHNNIEV